MPSDTPPTRPTDYAALSAGWGTLMGALLVATRDKGESRSGRQRSCPSAWRPSRCPSSWPRSDAWVREPFVEEHPDGRRSPKGTGVRYAVGELLTCTRCLGLWSALGLVALRVTRPPEARVV